jgi:hypothetical protein
MKLSNDTVSVLKNFSGINSGLFFNKGTKISTISPTKAILAKATLKDDFPKDFGIYDLNEFLSLLSIGKETPEIEFDTVNVLIKSLGGRSKTKYRVTDKSMIVTPPDKAIIFSSVHTTFTLTEEDHAWIIKNANVLQSPNIAIIGADGILKLGIFDAKNDSKPNQEVEIGTTEKAFRFVFATENIKLIPGAYVVEIAKEGIAHFTNTNGAIEYWVTTERDLNKV